MKASILSVFRTAEHVIFISGFDVLCVWRGVFRVALKTLTGSEEVKLLAKWKGVTSIQMFERNHVLFIVWSFAPFVVSHRFAKCCHQIFPLPCLGLRPVSSSQSFECSAWYESCACCGFSERVGPCASCKSHLEASVWEITWQDS